MRRRLFLGYIAITLLMPLVSACSLLKQEPATLYVYHNFSPFWLEPEAYSLSQLLVDSLNQGLGLRYRVEPINRKALNELIGQGGPVRVLWANERWFPQRSPVISKPIIWDSDILVTHRSTGAAGVEIDTLKGNRFCGIAGHHYRHLEPWLSEGVIERVDADSPRQCLALLEHGGVDYMQMERSSFYNMLFTENFAFIDIVEPSVDTFTRHILLFNMAGADIANLDERIEALGSLDLWREGLKGFGDGKFISLFDMNFNQLMELEVR